MVLGTLLLLFKGDKTVNCEISMIARNLERTSEVSLPCTLSPFAV